MGKNQHSIQAESESDKAGFYYKDRHGNERNNDPKDLTGLALRGWCEDKGLTYT